MEKGIKQDRPKIIFEAFIILFALVIILGSLMLKGRARIFPSAVSLILLAMAGLQIAADLWPKVSFFKFISQKGLTDTINRQEREIEEEEITAEVSYNSLGLLALFMVFFWALFRYLSVFLAIPVFIVLSLRLIKKENWIMVSALAIGSDVFIWLIFSFFLKMRF